MAETIHWSSPVVVQIGYGFPENVRGPQEALDYLQWRWPVRHGNYYFEALRECADFLKQQTPLDRAREIFVLASIEAKMLAGAAA